MIEIRFNNEELFERMHEALKGSRGYIDNEIILSKDANGHCLTVGFGEDPNLTIKLNELELYDAKEVNLTYGDFLKVSETKSESSPNSKLKIKPVVCINKIGTMKTNYKF